jgi:hypothetical protein
MNVSDLKTLIRALSPNERSIVISKYLKNKVIFQQNKCYFLRSNITYDSIDKYKDKLLPAVITVPLSLEFRRMQRFPSLLVLTISMRIMPNNPATIKMF